MSYTPPGAGAGASWPAGPTDTPSPPGGHPAAPRPGARRAGPGAGVRRRRRPRALAVVLMIVISSRGSDGEGDRRDGGGLGGAAAGTVPEGPRSCPTPAPWRPRRPAARAAPAPRARTAARARPRPAPACPPSPSPASPRRRRRSPARAQLDPRRHLLGRGGAAVRHPGRRPRGGRVRRLRRAPAHRPGDPAAVVGGRRHRHRDRGVRPRRQQGGWWKGGEPGVINGLEWYLPDEPLPATGTYVIRAIHTGGSHEPFVLGFFGNA